MSAVRYFLILFALFLFPLQVSGATLASALEKGDFGQYRQVLNELIENRLKSKEFRANDRILVHALAVEELIRTTGVESLNHVAKTSEGMYFLKKFLADRDWVEMYVSSGPFPENIPDGLLTLARIFQEDPDSQNEPYKALATSLPLTFYAGEQHRRNRFSEMIPPLDPVARYHFYKKSHQAGKLHKMFDTLPVWALRFVVGTNQDEKTLAWLQTHVNLPVGEIDGACWIPRYRGVNSFGNTIQGALFYAPSRPVMSCWGEDVAKNGGVCGALSTFGAAYAQSRGIPATTKGQPGHCAYAYRAAPGEWVACFGGPDGSSHIDFWKDQFAYTWMEDDLFSDMENTRAAHQLYWLARHQQEHQGLRGAFATYQQALAKQPLHYGIRKAFIEACLADDSSFMNEKRWTGLTNELLSGGMQKHPMPMHDLLALFDEKKLWPALSPERRFRLFVDEHKAIATNIRLGWTPWNIPAQVLQRQVKAVPGKEIELFRETLANYIQVGQQHLIGELIGWGGKRFTGTQEKDYIAAVIGAFSKSKTKDEKVIRQIFQQAIVSAEASKNIAAFQQLNRAVRNMVVPETKYDYKAPPRGKLVSDKGMIYFGKLDNWDPPLQHRGILLETGGAFHGPGTFDGKPNFAVVVLPDGRKLAGIVIVNRPGHENRNKSLKIYTSTDEQNWTQIGQCDDFRNEFRLDLREKNITARFIKVEKGQPENEPFHLRNICVYAD